MQERRVRLGDILDDYCPRERRITNHAVVAIVEDDVKQTRCTTCDADHVYKHAKAPASRRKKPDVSAGDLPELAEPPTASPGSSTVADDDTGVQAATAEVATAEAGPLIAMEASPASPVEDVDSGESEAVATQADDEWPVHRRLIRATLPRPEGQAPERKAPDFFHQTGGRNDREPNGNRHGRRGRGGHGQGGGQSQPMSSRPGGSRQGGGHAMGNSQRPPRGQRGGGPQGQGGGQRPSQGRRPRRGR